MSVSAASATAAAGTTGSAAAKDTAQELSDRFMKLLVAQLQNQDPLNPTDNAEITSQMAQINTVSGISDLNVQIAAMVEEFRGAQALQAAQLTGRTVLAEGSTLRLEDAADGSGPGARGAFQLAGAADTVQVEVRDANGLLVRTLPVTPAATGGLQHFSWDGSTDAGAAAAAGSYTFKVKASSSGSSVTATSYAAHRVEGVSQSDGTVSLLVAGGGRIAYADVQQIL